MKAITNAKIVTATTILEDYSLLFDQKILTLVPHRELENYEITEVWDAQGNYVSPGFLDIHVHGVAGSDTMDDNEETLHILSQSLTKTGVTSFLPTTMTMDFDRISKTLHRIRKAKAASPGAEVLGCHLEGPFINSAFKGAQDSTYILDPDFNKIAKFTDLIKIVTLAPEQPGSMDFHKKMQGVWHRHPPSATARPIMIRR